MNKIRPRSSGLSTSRTVERVTLPRRTMVPLDRRVNTPTAPMIRGNSRIIIKRLVTGTANFVDTGVRSPFDKAVRGVSGTISS